MKKVKEVELEIPKTEIRCFFCYCSMKNEVAYNLDTTLFYHYECIIEKFKANEAEEFELLKLDGNIEIVKVPAETKKSY
ncbi:MAG: hypothetical protein U0354_07330 [Candidatus Sericytochromatia bacterium]